VAEKYLRHLPGGAFFVAHRYIAAHKHSNPRVSALTDAVLGFVDIKSLNPL
jgi:hypothetical protein